MKYNICKSIFLVLLFFLISQVGFAQIYVSGKITDIDTGDPVPAHEVFIVADDSVAYYVLYTDNDGVFGGNIGQAAFPISKLFLYVYDCDFVKHDTSFVNPPDTTIANFEICYENNPNQCQSFFYFIPDSLDRYTFRFLNLSHFPEIAGSYGVNWDFGDGLTSTEMNPTHTYSEDGFYYVCLQIYDSEGFCNDTYCAMVEAPYPSGHCNAMFIYEADPTDPKTIAFTDLSSGLINNWHWDFGDGTTSDEQYPIHTFDGFGNFEVCLSIVNEDSVASCNDTFCKLLVLIDTSIACKANFIARPDSISGVENLFYFTDKSTGNISNWYWDFGDGNYSEEQNPTHKYIIDGIYEVCLTASNEYAPENCFDQLCKEINTPRYFDVGGLVFAGDYPLNNPVSTGDTGIAMLYRKFDGDVALAVDTCLFHHAGYYHFLNVIEGDYLVKVALTKNSNHFAEYFPTYFSDETDWLETSSLSLTDSNYYTANINLFPSSEMNGLGSVMGSVGWCLENKEDINFTGSINNIQLILSDKEMKALSFVYSDENGTFTFEGISPGEYIVSADLTGAFSSFAEIIISSTSLMVEVEIELCEHKVIGIDENHISENIPFQLFPNPVKEVLYLDFEEVISGKIQLEIYNIFGSQIRKQNSRYEGQLFKMDLPNLQPGVYLLRVLNDTNHEIAKGKFIKN
jgi:PKD domain/Secretion system C-terminal sorting domain